MQFCTGTLIDPNWVLTAAHCVREVSVNDFEVAIGLENLESAFIARQAVSEIISHPAFSFNTLQNDIALLRLETPSENEVIALSEKDFLNTKARILGWGLSIQDDSECEIAAFDGEVDLENFFCEKFEYSTSNLPFDLLETELNFVSYTACANRINASISEKGFDDSYFITAEDINESLYCAWDFPSIVLVKQNSALMSATFPVQRNWCDCRGTWWKGRIFTG